MSSNNLPHVTVLTLTDMQLAMLIDSVQVAVLTLGLHPAAQDPQTRALAVVEGLAVMQDFSTDEWVDLHKMLSVATEDISDPNLSSFAPSFQDVKPPKRFTDN